MRRERPFRLQGRSSAVRRGELAEQDSLGCGDQQRCHSPPLHPSARFAEVGIGADCYRPGHHDVFGHTVDGAIGAEGDEEPNAVCEVHSNRESYWPPGFRFVPFVG